MQGSEIQRQALDSELTYVSFRAALVMTLDAMLATYLDDNSARSTQGFLDRLPLLEGCAPHVQLERLLTTWHAVVTHAPLTLGDEVVIQAAAETLCDICTNGQERTQRLVWRGPLKNVQRLDHWTASKVRLLQVMLSDSDLAILCSLPELQNSSDNTAVSAIESPVRSQRGELMEVIGRWKVTKEMLNWEDGLLTDSEQSLIRAFFEEHPYLLS
ncbi:MAG: hypothetical protein KDA85_11015 [Planctomycetaceae bacterium]|nr:hypothetical protein [Planctomycetaceae bacterium]